MVVSNSFKELSAVLEQLESSGTTVQHAVMDQDLSSADSDLTAKLAVDVPILADDGLAETVSIETEDAVIDNGRIAVDLTVTVSGGETENGGPPSNTRRPNTSGNPSNIKAVPAYKDPEALQAVYEQYDSFPEMTEALGVDVTSETVRRHMIEYDIHNPNDTTPKAFIDATATNQADEQTDIGESRGPVTASPEAHKRSTGKPDTDPKRSDGTPDTTTSVSDKKSSQEAANAVTDGGSVPVDSTTSDMDSPFAAVPVSELVADATTHQSPDSSVSDEYDLPESVTVGGLTDAINQSQTIHEVTQHIGLNRSAAKHLLQELSLIDFVSHRLAADQITVSQDEVVRRIKNAGQ